MYLQVYNKVFDYNLSANALKVYLFLSHCSNVLGAATVRTSTIMERTGIKSAVTVRQQIATLKEKGLVSAVARFNAQRRSISNQYQITPLKGRWFVLRLENNPFLLNKSDFQVYLYLSCRANRIGRAFPSLTIISNALHMSRQTVCDAIANLVAFGFVRKAAKWAGKHNLYLLQNVLEIAATATAHKKNEVQSQHCTSNTQKRASHRQKNAIPVQIISHLIETVKNGVRRMRSWLSSLKNVHQY